jgi:hypothetical protein
MSATEHSLYSSYREALLEHLFSGEVMRYLWLQGVIRMEVLKPQVDDGGYDLVLEANTVTRHVQLKSSHHRSTTASVGVNIRLAEKPSGCIIWMRFDSATLALGPFLWFGGQPGEPLPDLSGFATGKQARGNAQGVKSERPNIRVVPRAWFVRIPSIEELSVRLFGVLNTVAPERHGLTSR